METTCSSTELALAAYPNPRTTLCRRACERRTQKLRASASGEDMERARAPDPSQASEA